MKLYNKQKVLIVDLDTSKEIARGGEGMIIDNGIEVVKLYLPGIKTITEIKFNDLAELKSNIFVKPEKLVYDSKGKILGFTMNKVPSDHYPILDETKYVITEIRDARTDPHIRSTIVTTTGQSFKVARLVRSYVA